MCIKGGIKAQEAYVEKSSSIMSPVAEEPEHWYRHLTLFNISIGMCFNLPPPLLSPQKKAKVYALICRGGF